jgi:hypothetical protein
MPRLDLIDMKINRVLLPMIADLGRNQKVVHRIGGATISNLGEEIKFQRSRLENLEWARTATDEAIKEKITDITLTLSADEKACKYGSVRGLTLETIEKIAIIEDLEISIGIHPGVS